MCGVCGVCALRLPREGASHTIVLHRMLFYLTHFRGVTACYGITTLGELKEPATAAVQKSNVGTIMIAALYGHEEYFAMGGAWCFICIV